MNLLARVRPIALVSGVETFGVAAGGIAGLLIVNVLPKEQYAVYTFLLACMTLLLGVTDLGLAHCVLPVVGQRARRAGWVVGVCQRIFHWRWMLLALGGAVVLPYWLQTAWLHGWGGRAYLGASLLAVAVVLLMLRDSYLHTVLLVLEQVPAINRAALGAHLLRFALVCAVLFALPRGDYSVAGLFAATALSAAAGVWLLQRAQGWRALPAPRLSAGQRRWVDREALRIALPLLPSAVFYQVQGVITVMIVSVFGTVDMMAEVGAFARLALILTVLDRVTNMLLFPKLARAPAGPGFVDRLVRVHAAYLASMALFFATSLLAPHAWMLLLGPKYAHMEPYLWMVFLAFIAMNAAGFAFRTLTVRGATRRQGYSIALVIAVQAAYAAWFGVGDLRAVLGFNLATSLVHLFYQYGLLAWRLPGWRLAPTRLGQARAQPLGD